jgi:hypothetical protein
MKAKLQEIKMIEMYGDIWTQFQKQNQIVIVTTNNVIGATGLIMGAGIAKEAKDRLPNLPQEIASFYKVNPRLWNDGDYLLYIHYTQGIGCLQTKRNWKNRSPIDLVQKSIEILDREARLPTNEHIMYNVPRPGCGLGGLDWKFQVRPLCEALPDNVVIWSKT